MKLITYRLSLAKCGPVPSGCGGEYWNLNFNLVVKASGLDVVTRAGTSVLRCLSWFLSFRSCWGVLQKYWLPLRANPSCYSSCVLVNLCVCVVLTSRVGHFADHRACFPSCSFSHDVL